MLTRRSFLLGQLAGVSWFLPNSVMTPAFALGKRAKPTEAAKPVGPHSLARQAWAPAIIPDHIAIADRGFCCFADEFGRLAIVDLRTPGNEKRPVSVVSELSGLGKKLIDFKTTVGRAYALVVKEVEGSDAQPTLLTINLTPINEPSVAAVTPLDKYAEVTCLAVSPEHVCLGGTSISGENLVTIFSNNIRKGKGFGEPSQVSVISAEMSVTKMDLQDRNLLLLEGGPYAQLEYVSLTDPSTPRMRSTLKLEGEFRSMARFKDTVIVPGNATGSKGGYVAKCIALEPEPKVVSQAPLDPMTNILDATAQMGRFVVVGEGNGDRILTSFNFDKSKNLRKESSVNLPKSKVGFGATASALLYGRNCYIGSGWAGVQVLAWTPPNWTPTYTYSIPRLPASSLAAWGDLCVLAGSDLKLYDLKQMTRPVLTSTADVSSAVKSVVGAGSFIICLMKDSMSLRKMDRLGESVTTVKVAGQILCFDKTEHRAYVLKESGKTTTASRFQVYSNSLIADKVYDLQGTFNRASANAGHLLVGAVNDISLYKTDDTAVLVGSRHFENLGVRDVVLMDDCILVSAIDQNSKGFLLVLSREEKDLHVLGTIDLPHDAVALAALKSTAVVIGRTADGKDVAAIVDFSTPTAPKISSTVATIEAASAITIKDKYALVAGRGLDILTLS